MPNEELLAALLTALEHDPASVPIRLQVGQLLLDGGDPSAALDQFVNVLGRQPANAAALRGAGQAARAIGDTARADAYLKMEQALSDTQEAPPEPVPATGEGPPAGGPADTPWWETITPGINLADVGGMEAVKKRLEVSFFGPMRSPDMQRAFGLSLRGGLLLYGPPGCGKTFLARAVAGELGAHFIPVGLSDVLDMWFGESERRMHELFEGARRHHPSVLFLDEIDALGQKRSQLRHHAPQRSVVNQLLSELDGVKADNEGVYILAATNHPWDVDSALLRPGRFDRIAFVAPPDQAARAAILRYHLRERPVGDVDYEKLAAGTADFSGADLAHLCASATELALADSVARGQVRPINEADLRASLKELRPSTGAWFETARNFVLFANQAGNYDELQDYMRAHKLL
jgi:SpoVK/Ycf46/Vps4 family AAA+-type ATPase